MVTKPSNARISLLLWTALQFAFFCIGYISSASQARAELPNIVLILVDDLGYGDLSCYNDQAKVATPHIDQLARQGMRFLDAHSPCTVCTPTRYSLMTGHMAFRIPNGGTVFSGVGGPSLITPERLTLPEMLKNRGYATACVGKWHIGLTFFDTDGKPVSGNGVDAIPKVDFRRAIEGGPTSHGFDSFFGTACCPTTDWLYAFIENDRVPVAPTKLLDKTSLPQHPYANDCRRGWIAPNFPMEDVDLEFLKKSQEFLDSHVRTNPAQPFFLFHSTQAVHLPSFAAKQFQGTSKAGPHGDFILELDFIVGELLDQLEQLGVANNTIVIVTSDNGPEVASVVHMRKDHQHDGARPWRGIKRDAWEGGHRVPLIVRWPNHVPAQTENSQLCSLTDVMATIAAITETELPNDAAEDSFNMWPAWQAPNHPPIRDYLLTQAFAGKRTLTIRRGPWKYIAHPGSGGNRYENSPELQAFAIPDDAPQAPGQLYNLDTDPGERHNLYLQQPALVQELKSLLEDSIAKGRSCPRRP